MFIVIEATYFSFSIVETLWGVRGKAQIRDNVVTTHDHDTYKMTYSYIYIHARHNAFTPHQNEIYRSNGGRTSSFGSNVVLIITFFGFYCVDLFVFVLLCNEYKNRLRSKNVPVSFVLETLCMVPNANEALRIVCIA